MNNLSIYLREKRVSKKLSQTTFAKMIGLSFQTYTKLEQGKRPFSMKALKQIALALNEGIDKLLRLSLESHQVIASNPKKPKVIRRKKEK